VIFLSRKTVKIISIIIAAALIIGMLFSALYGVAYADTLQEQLEKADKKKKDAQTKLNTVKKEREKSLASQENLEKELIALQNKVNDINAEIGETDKKLSVEEGKLNEATARANTQYESFKERFRVLCEEGPVTYLEILFSADNFCDFVDKIEIATEISQNDKAVFDEMEVVRAEIEASRNQILELKQTQVAAKDNLSQQQAQLNAKKAEQKSYIASLESDAAAYQKVIDDQDKAMDALKNKIAASLSNSSGSGKTYVGGEFMWPSSCTLITSHFSPRRKNPVSGVYKRHTGVDIGAAYGTAVLAANSGTVTLAGWNSGYGNCIVIDHGGGKATLYAHLSSIGVSKGQSVTKGNQIGKVGSTGNSTGPHIHFEILINGSAVNPMQYFK